jgi:hypothetical protein
MEAKAGGAFLERAPSHYPVNIRLTWPFFPKPFFVTLVIGREKRGLARRKEERARHPLNTWGNLAVFVATWTIFSVAALFAASVMATL